MTRKDQLRNIYHQQSPDTESEMKMSTAKQEEIELRLRLERIQTVNRFLGGIVLLLFISFTAVTVRKLISARFFQSITAAASREYIPFETGKPDTPWVASCYTPDADNRDPMSIDAMKETAYQLISADAAIQSDHDSAALEHFIKILEIKPDIEGIHYQVGRIYLQREQFETAAKHLELALNEEPVYIVADRLGEAYEGIQQYDQAETARLKALDIAPENSEAHLKLAQLYRDMEQPDDARFYYEKYLGLEPDDQKTLQHYAFYLIELNRTRDAEEFLSKMAAAETDVAPVYFILARLQIENGNRNEAIQSLKAGTKLISRELARTWLKRSEYDPLRNRPDFQQLLQRL